MVLLIQNPLWQQRYCKDVSMPRFLISITSDIGNNRHSPKTNSALTVPCNKPLPLSPLYVLARPLAPPPHILVCSLKQLCIVCAQQLQPIMAVPILLSISEENILNQDGP